MKPTPPCRLYFILARKAPVGVIFRRGPSKWVQIIKWNTEDDTFEPGQWFNGRIYERRCDLSPSGDKLIYFAQKMKARSVDPEITYAWTAVSRIPYLTALALWPKGDCWNGGGLFESENRVWLNHPDDAMAFHKDHHPPNLRVHNYNLQRGEDSTVLNRRLDREGWTEVKPWKGELFAVGVGGAFEQNIGKARPSEVDWLLSLHSVADSKQNGYVTYGAAISEKQRRDGRYSLIKRWVLIGLDDCTMFRIRNNETGERFDINNASLADWDQACRLVFAADGKLFEGLIGPEGVERRELVDFNANKPEPVEAPDWAKIW